MKMTWDTIKSKKIADFPLFKVFEDLVELPNGLKLDYYMVDKIPAVAILPIIDDKIILTKQYRYPIQSMSLELPAGHININETLVDCAIRELKEETGFTAGKIEKLFSYNPSTEYSTQTYHIFIAEYLTEGKPDRESYELIYVEILEKTTIFEKINRGAITDSRTIIAVLFAKYINRL